MSDQPLAKFWLHGVQSKPQLPQVGSGDKSPEASCDYYAEQNMENTL